MTFPPPSSAASWPAYPNAFDEGQWVEKILVLMSKGSIRIVSEIGRLLLDLDKKEELHRELDRWLGDHTISAGSATWLCKERGGPFAAMVDARVVLSAILSPSNATSSTKTSAAASSTISSLKTAN